MSKLKSIIEPNRDSTLERARLSSLISIATLDLDRRRLMRRARVGVAGLLSATLFLLTLLLVAACRCGTPEVSGGAKPESSSNRSVDKPIAPAVVQAEVERRQAFQQLRKAVCPRRLPDRHEERRRYPAVDVLQGLQYVTISDDSSRGSYEKVIELTGDGRRDLANELDEEPERYVITIASREYLIGSERYENAPGRDDRMIVSFRWRWKALNALGERLNLRAPYGDRVEHQGRATYVRTDGAWRLDELWLESDGKNYMFGV